MSSTALSTTAPVEVTRPSELCASLVLLMEIDQPSAGSSRLSLEGMDELTVGRGRPRGIQISPDNPRKYSLAVPDGAMSKVHARMIRMGPSWRVEDANSTNGVLVNGYPSRTAVLATGDLVRLGNTYFLFQLQHSSNLAGPRLLESRSLLNPLPLCTFQESYRRELALAEGASRAGVSVLVEGPFGAGKAAIAEHLHQVSTRSGPLGAVLCATASREQLDLVMSKAGESGTTPLCLDRPDLEGTLWLSVVDHACS